MSHQKKKHQKQIHKDKALTGFYSRKDKDLYDVEVYVALRNLPQKLPTSKGTMVAFGKGKRDEGVYEHIALKRHELRVVDILAIPLILLDPKSIVADRKSKRYENYVGDRPGNKVKPPFLKIITKKGSGKKESKEQEEFVTVYTVKSKK